MTMNGIIGADGGFAEYMITSDDATMKIPDEIPFEQAVPLMCAGATVWNGILEANLQKGQTVEIVGIGGLGLLGIQFAKALGYRVVAISNHDLGLKLRSEVPQALWSDLSVSSTRAESIQQISDFTDGIGLQAAIVCTDNVSENDWVLHRLQPKGRTGIAQGRVPFRC